MSAEGELSSVAEVQEERPDGRVATSETLRLRAATRALRLHLDELPIAYDLGVTGDRFLAGLAFMSARQRYDCAERRAYRVERRLAVVTSQHRLRNVHFSSQLGVVGTLGQAVRSHRWPRTSRKRSQTLHFMSCRIPRAARHHRAFFVLSVRG